MKRSVFSLNKNLSTCLKTHWLNGELVSKAVWLRPFHFNMFELMLKSFRYSFTASAFLNGVMGSLELPMINTRGDVRLFLGNVFGGLGNNGVLFTGQLMQIGVNHSVATVPILE